MPCDRGRIAAMLGAAVLPLIAGSAIAADLSGIWITEGAEARIRIAPCGGGAYCGHIVGLREPRHPVTGRPATDEHNPDPRQRTRPLIGVRIVIGMKPNGKPASWSGHVYNAEDGHIYPAMLTMLTGKALRLEGCLLDGLLCQGQTWIRSQ